MSANDDTFTAGIVIPDYYSHIARPFRGNRFVIFSGYSIYNSAYDYLTLQ